MAIFIILVVSIALGVLLSRLMAKHGTGKWLRRPLATAAGVLVFLAALGVYLGNTASPTTAIAATTPVASRSLQPPRVADTSSSPKASGRRLDDGGVVDWNSPATPTTYQHAVMKLDRSVVRVMQNTYATPHVTSIFLAENSGSSEAGMVVALANDAMRVLRSGFDSGVLATTDAYRFQFQVGTTTGERRDVLVMQLTPEQITALGVRPFQTSAGRFLDAAQASPNGGFGAQVLAAFCAAHRLDAPHTCR